ncbi:F0F1 ATP synthase subunit epsilon [candidate division KSB1 bacterium]|nr:F0F1 ATP synthase subunit epsilon [candidate division KSB1 bacterium]
MAKTYKLEIVTPLKIVFSGMVIHVKAPGIAGYFGILYQHAPFLTALKIGIIEVKTEKEVKYFATSGGFAEVVENEMKILAETCECAEDIDEERAKNARDRALKRLAARSQEIDIPRAQAALGRALNRIQAADLK